MNMKLNSWKTLTSSKSSLKYILVYMEGEVKLHLKHADVKNFVKQSLTERIS